MDFVKFKGDKRVIYKRLSILVIVCIFILATFKLIPNKVANASTVDQNGSLKVIGTELCNSKGQPIQLKGMSSHGLQWYGNYINKSSVKALADDWGCNVVRLAMYTAEGGYITNPSVKAKVEEGIEAAIDAGIYVIVDWHILSDGNPNTYKEQAKDFFKDIASKYGKYPNVIYEICNEPNGNVTWDRDIKPYAEELVATIRAIDSDNIIIVGSGTWSQDIHDVAANPLKVSNVMYSLHFYAGTHTQWLRDRIDDARSKNLPIFVTEWGTSDASGNGGPYLEESKVWLDYLDYKNISWVNWSLCDKNESSAALNPGASKDGKWSDSNLSPSGKFVKERIKKGQPDRRQEDDKNSDHNNEDKNDQNNDIPGDDVTVTFDLAHEWNDGYKMEVVISNKGKEPVTQWKVKLKKSQWDISQLWNGTTRIEGDYIIVSSMDYNKNIASNGTVSFGFIGKGKAVSEPYFELVTN